MLTIRPTGNRVLVAVRQVQDNPNFDLAVVSHGKPLSGVVEAIGPKLKGIKVGDTVHFGPRAGFPIQSVDGPPLRMLTEAEVLAVEPK